MKKKFRLLLGSFMLTAFLLGSGNNANAQLFDQGDLVMSAGLGLGANYIGWGTYYKTTVPPLWIAGDYCLREKLGPGNLGVGGLISYSAYKYHYTAFGYDYGWKYTTIIIGARGSYHFTDLVDNLDLYGAVLLGAEIVTNKEFGDYYDDNYSANKSGAAYEFAAGARYYFSDNFAAMAELGYGVAWLKLGVSLKF